MSSGTAFKEQLLKVRREVQLSSDSKSLLRALKETQRCLNGLATEPNYKLCVAHLVKELLDWVALKDDRDLEPVPATKACLELLEEYLNVCHQAESATRCFLVVRLYNAFVALNRKDTNRRTKLYIARLMHRFPIADDQVDLFVRVKRVVLKTAHEAKETTDLMEEGADLLIEMQRKLLAHEANSAPPADGIREPALALFREVFDNEMAILRRLFPVSRAKAEQLYATIMDTMLTVVQPSEPELISLLGDSVGYVETILGCAGGESADYCKFAGFLTLFEGVRSEPYASCYQLISMLVELVKQPTPAEAQIESITKRVRAVHSTFPSHQLVVRIAIFLTCQAIPFLYRLPQELSLTVSHAAIGLCEALMHFVRQCPSDTVPELCRLCTSSRRHLADKLLSILMHLSIVQARNAAEQRNERNKLSYSIGRGCELIKRKLALLEELSCERKQSLIDTTMRYSISWLKYALTLLREEDQAATEEVEDIVRILKLIVSVQNRYRFEFLSDLHLVRLLENAYADRSFASPSCWPNVSIRLLKLLITLREASGSSEEHTATISSIVRSIMSYQINAPETDPIRSLTLLQLYDHPAYDRHGFTFDCTPSRAEKFTILAEEMALVTKYKTSNTLPVWEYMRELAKVGDVGENCLAFGMALHGFSESDAGKLPESMMDTLSRALGSFQPTNALERVKLAAAQAIISYHTFSLASRTTLNRLREIPFKVDQMRSGHIDEIMLENRLDREGPLKRRMEAIRKHYGELLVALAEDQFRSLWVLPSIAQISSILDNVARLYHLNYQPHRAVELQLLNLLLVSQRHDVRPLDQCASLGFLLEQHQLADAQLKKLHKKISPKHVGEALASLESLANRAKSLLLHPPETGLDDVPDNRRFQLLNLYLGLAVYYASRRELEQALRLIRRALDHLDRSGKVSAAIAPLFQGRAAQIIFRLATEYELPWPDSVPPLAFMKRMLSSFNALQKLSTEHTFTLSLATVDMTVAVLQYLIVRYDTGPLVEPHVEQLLKFVLRRGAGLRAMQLLLLYGQMCADTEKLDRCEIALSYLDRLLMFRPIRSQEEKENGQLVENALSPGGSFKSIHNNLPAPSLLNIEDLVDVEREAAPKHRIIPQKIALHEASPKETDIQHYLMFYHSPGCDCHYCSYPQYKLMAYQTAALAVRLSYLQHSKSRKHIERSYQSLIEHWEQMYPTLAAWTVPVYLSDVSVAVIRTHLNYGQFLVRRERFDRAREVYGWATELRTAIAIDPALFADIRHNLEALDFLARQRSAPTPVPKRSRSMIEARYVELLARKGKTNADGNAADGMGQLTANLSNLTMKTPKAARPRAPPKTVDRVNELLRQAATRRHQLKTNQAPTDGLTGITEGIIPNRVCSSQSARKPRTVSIFVDSPPSAKGRVVAVPATVAKMQKPTPAVVKISKAKDPIDGSSEESIGWGAKIRRGGKRALMNEPAATPSQSADSYRDALVKETPVCSTPPPTARPELAGNITARKVRRLVVEEFPSLSDSSDTDASTKTPLAPNRTDSPGPPLNGSFRDALVLGTGAPQKDDSSVVIVLDDSNDSSHKSEEAIETSFVQSHAVSADKRAGLSLKSYSDRKRLLDSAGRPLPGSAVRPVATKRRTPLLAAKTKLRFDEPSPEQVQTDGAKHSQVEKEEASNGKAPKKLTDGKPIRAHRTKAIEPVPASTAVNTSDQSNKMESRISCIATRTRLRRKRI
ncbi:uncharacterized protein LOC118506566 [Anopheles stephensi]|uniref:uncharacterized protein LOC118506566 n=1 Tax=Anopheles stephensi TaxID=30069 RepID=UPI001658B6F8|nr:uncharacterized protein LOC118506566 [Anopheles stephensi]XP_035899783.1 uncharacterized protein LOC118506566 [Anopheles stephensi]